MTADGSKLRDIAQAWAPIRPRPEVGTMIPFDLARDGTQVVFATCAYPRPGSVTTGERANRAYGYELTRVGAMGGAPRRLTANQVFDGYPAWSPDGRRVAFLHDGVDGYVDARQLSTIGVDGADARGIVKASEGTFPVLHPPVWSPDGRRLAFVGVDVSDGFGLYTVAADGAELQQLSDLRPLTKTVGSAPAWSPDGSRIVIAIDDEPSLPDVVLYSMAPDGTGLRMLVRRDGDGGIEAVEPNGGRDR